MKKTMHASAYAEQVPHRHVPGRAYEVADAVEKLIHTIGGGFFNEPKYYDSNRTSTEFYRELRETGRISSTIRDQMGLTEQAAEVLQTACNVARSTTPEDLLVIAAWARDPREGLKLRTTPAVLLAIAAAELATKELVARYAPAILRRADEVRLVFATFRHFFQQAEDGRHKGALPHCLRKGLAAALAECSAYELLKYDSRDRPTFGDVLKMVGGSRKLPNRCPTGWPVSKAMFEYLVNGRVLDDAPAILHARKQFFATNDPAKVTKELIQEAGLTWENVLSHLGSTAAVWELVIPVMGEMALTRNLRNFEQSGISEAAWAEVRRRMDAVERTMQLPFRFFAAEREVTSARAKDIVSAMLDRACACLADLPGVSVVLSDNSGSAVGCAVSGASDLCVADAGNTLGAVLAKRCPGRVHLGVFGDSLIWVPTTAQDSCMAIKQRMDHLALRAERSAHGALAIPRFRYGQGVGAGTETGLWWALHDITRRRLRANRIVLLSDLCCYTQGDVNCGVRMAEYFGARATVQSMIDMYRQEVNDGIHVYSINLSGHGQSQLRPGEDRTRILSGWSEKVFDLMRRLESGVQECNDVEALPTIEVLRQRYRR
jgi:hypothetical protein